MSLGDLQRRNAVIVLLDASRQDVRRWLLRDAWPVKYDGPTLDAKANEVAIESIELACEDVDVEA